MEGISSLKISSLNYLYLTNSDLHQSAVSLKEACMDTGFFYVMNHGISDELKDEVVKQSKKFFALPLEDKMKVSGNERRRGYSQVLEHIQKLGDCKKENYVMRNHAPKNNPQREFPFYSPNTWPDSDGLPGWRETMEKYHQELTRVCKAIARMLALALDLDADYFDNPEMLGNPTTDMVLFQYEVISDPFGGMYASIEHTDPGMISLLATDGVMGLKICKDKEGKPQEWEFVPSIKGAYIVNIGNLMKRWSNGLFKSTFHQLLGNNQNPNPIMFFMGPCYDCLVECLPTCQSQNNLDKYPPIKYSTYLTQDPA